jgi:eukaryotic-like serine/threonine-protein kinase
VREEPTKQLRIRTHASGVLAGRYRLDERLGSGGMGAVYKAMDLELDEPIAIKLFERESLTPENVAQLRREVRLARKVTHRNVARIHDIGEYDGRWFLTMQLVEGQTLRKELEARGALPRREAHEVVAEICEGVAAAHAVGVLHLDLKPENVMRPPGGGVVVLDFGIARSVGELPDPGHSSGTPAYMAPEQRAGQADQRTDLYAVGMILYELLVGRRPAEEGAPRVDAIPGSNEASTALLDSLLAFAPELRPSSARVVLEVLHRLLGMGTARSELQRHASRTRIAVLPFLGDNVQATSLAAGITEELADRLTSLRETSVLTTSATSRFAGSEPVAAAIALGVDSVVEGIVHQAGDVVQVTARLVEGTRGEITWSDRFEAPMRDVLSLQDRMARRIAEALRVELGTLPFRGIAPRSALELYMRARAKVARLDLEGQFGAIADLEKAKDLAPDLAPATALQALACVRAWFASVDPESSRTRAFKAIAEATARAAEFPETQLAAGVLAFQRGEIVDAVEHLERTLDMAPSHPLALEYSGRLLCEAGHATEGFRRIELACGLDPKLGAGLLDVARHFALHRAWTEYESTVERVVHRGFVNIGLRVLQVRVATWRRLGEQVARFANELVLHHGDVGLVVLYADALLGKVETAALPTRLAEVLPQQVSRRYATTANQLAVEVLADRGDLPRALHHLEQANAYGLIDLEWLDLCPMLGQLRTLEPFAKVRQLVRARVAGLWR